MEKQSEQNRRKQFGRAIQYLLDERGYTHHGFARGICYLEANLYEILHGQVILTRAEKVKFAKYLNLRDKRQSGSWDPYSDLSDEALDSLFLDSVPKDEPKLPYLDKF